MFRRLLTRATLAFVLVLTGLGVTLSVASTPASAADNLCLFSKQVQFNDYVGTTPDGVPGVTDSPEIILTPTTAAPECNAPYEGYNSTCITVRLVIYLRPGVGPMITYGPWVRSCWTPVPLASGWGGWLHSGDHVILQARAEQDLGHYPNGILLA